MAWDGSGWLPPRSTEPDVDNAAFSTEDVHGYFELSRRIRNTAILAGTIALPSAIILIGWKVLS